VAILHPRTRSFWQITHAHGGVPPYVASFLFLMLHIRTNLTE